ncbi:MAG: hypothetical protein IJF37_05175 [Lachnospiraceae bacterium]|nr:hypothetical protein [Lachnospiraceae bacterium]
MREMRSIKLCQNVSEQMYRRIWHTYACKNFLMVQLCMLVMVIYVTRRFIGGEILEGIVCTLVIELLVLLYLLRVPRKMKNIMNSYPATEVIFSDESLKFGEVEIAYSDIRKVFAREQFVIIKARRKKLVLVGENSDSTCELYNSLKYNCAYRAKFDEEKTYKLKTRIFQCCAFVTYIFISVHAVWLIVNYDRLVEEYTTKFKQVYDIELYIPEETKEIEGYIIEEASSKYDIIDTLESIDNILERFPENMFRELDIKVDETEIMDIQLKLYISCDIEEQGGDKLRAAGVTIANLPDYEVYIDCETGDVESVFAHEMFHVIGNGVGDSKLDIIKNVLKNVISGGKYTIDEVAWYQYNPSGFMYYENRIIGGASGWEDDDSFTEHEDDIEDVYFVSNYAKSAIHEDMAEVFKYLVSCDNNLPSSYDSPHVQAKAKYLIQWLDDNFESVTEDVYWNKWYK